MIEYRTAEGRPERLLDLAGDLARRQVKVIVATVGSNAALVANATNR